MRACHIFTREKFSTLTGKVYTPIKSIYQMPRIGIDTLSPGVIGFVERFKQVEVQGNGVCALVWVAKNGDEIGRIQTACAGFLSFNPGASITRTYKYLAVRILNAAKRDGIAYLIWLLTTSPWAPVYRRAIYMDRDVMLFDVDNLDIPCNLFINALIALRTPYEFPAAATIWSYLCEKRVYPELACMAASLARYSTITEGLNWKVTMGSHSAFGDNGLGLSYTRNFCAHRSSTAHNSMYRDMFSYHVVNDVWGTGDGCGLFNAIHPTSFPDLLQKLLALQPEIYAPCVQETETITAPPPFGLYPRAGADPVHQHVPADGV